MNKTILNTGVQYFISKNLNTDIVSVLLKKPQFDGISQKELAEQLESKKKCREKLPIWFNTPNIYYPNKLNIEQTSSEATARYKSKLIDGKTLLDLTGGFGVDSYFFSRQVANVWHCEMDPRLSEIASHNYEVLGCENIQCLPKDGIQVLQNFPQQLDWVYADPSRRNDHKEKVFFLQDCLPNIPEHLDLIFAKTTHVLIKTSPLLDLTHAIADLRFVKEVHVVAIKNEVKELLFVLEKDFIGDIQVKTVNLVKDHIISFTFGLKDERNTQVSMGPPQAYLYEPNAAILKAGGFKSVGTAFNLKKLHQHSHLYTSPTIRDFPGRRFQILQVLPYSKASMKTLSGASANITTRNFPISVAELRKKHKIKDGGQRYLFFTKTLNDQLTVLECKRIP